MSNNPSQADRYRRQIRFAPLGEAGQQRLQSSRVLVCGCGALGSVVADTLARAGVGFLRIVDRDFVELDNLHRQVLFTEYDAEAQLPKAVAAAQRLAAANTTIEIEPIVADINKTNIRNLAEDVDLIVDGTDNFETRYLINDLAIAIETPWIFGGCVGSEGQTFAIVPGQTPCLACIMPAPPPASVQPTCESAGVLGPIVNVIASMQSIEALKVLSGNRDQRNPAMIFFDLWNNQIRPVCMANARVNDCPVCNQHLYDWLDGDRLSATTKLCGRNSVQISPAGTEKIDLVALAKRLDPLGQTTSNPFMVRFSAEEYQLTIFTDGRTIVSGTEDPAIARTVHAKYVGN